MEAPRTGIVCIDHLDLVVGEPVRGLNECGAAKLDISG
jgi:hypothetical protein